MKLILISVAALLAFISVGEGLYIKGAAPNGKGEEIHGTDPDKEEAGVPASTLPADFDFGDIPLSRSAEDPGIIAEEESGMEQDFIWEDDTDVDPDYVPAPEETGGDDEAEEAVTGRPGEDGYETPEYEEAESEPAYEETHEPEDPDATWVDADTDKDEDVVRDKP